MKKILHILACNTFYGAENVVCTIIDIFNNEFDMAYCCPIGPIEKILKEKNIKYYGIKKLSIKELKKVIDEYKPDIIHAHDVKASLLASFFSKKVKVISQIHFSGIGMNKKSIKAILYNLVCNKFEKIIWVSNSCYNAYIYKSNVEKKSVILKNIIKVNKPNELKNEFDIIFIGRMKQIKNPFRAIKIIEKVKNKYPNIKSVFIGDGELLKEINSYIKENNLTDNIKIMGYVNNPLDYINNSKVMLMTSVSEGIPISVLEAMSLGVPVISTKVEGLNELISNENGYIGNNDNEITNKLIELISNKGKLNELKKSTMKYFENINDIEKYKNTLRKIYRG